MPWCWLCSLEWKLGAYGCSNVALCLYLLLRLPPILRTLVNHAGSVGSERQQTAIMRTIARQVGACL
jgi:hypothetical protein